MKIHSPNTHPLLIFLIWWIGGGIVLNVLFALLGLYSLADNSALIGFVIGIILAVKQDKIRKELKGKEQSDPSLKDKGKIK